MPYQMNKRGGSGSAKKRDTPDMSAANNKKVQQARPKHPGQAPKRGTKASKKTK